METSAATPTRPPHRNPTAASPSPSPSSLRLWRPAAQRNLRNQWSRLVKAKDDWLAAADEGLSHATALANAHNLFRFMPGTDLGALKDMPGIRDKARGKLALREEQYRSMLLSSYQEMVHALSPLVNASRSMRCFSNVPTNSALARYSDCQADVNDSGDGGGIPVFKWLSILEFEGLAQELVDMFVSELMLKRLLVLELLWITLKDVGEYEALDWEDELYDGESNEFQSIGLQAGETCRLPENWRVYISGTQRRGDAPSYEVLQIYLVTWRANVNVKKSRLNEIFELAITEEGMPVRLS
ncbi:hypothetical protein QOZ80_3BG0289340 [Eleusine coracana subsp. coracana]|nr:hypothetical protein QOZ80_3BG0289340 [Eleusine coracana subsp. coracana]